MKTYIFDIDNTIANNEHRIHHLRAVPKEWSSWHAKYLDDTPYWEIIELMDMAHESGIKVILCTGRDANYREETIKWLDEHAIHYDKLYMRPKGERKDDSEVKRDLLKEIRKDGFDPVLVFEDRDRVVKMWREEGLRCLQVAEGNF